MASNFLNTHPKKTRKNPLNYPFKALFNGFFIDFWGLILRKLVLGIADGVMKADGNPIYEVKDMKVGLFTPDK